MTIAVMAEDSVLAQFEEDDAYVAIGRVTHMPDGARLVHVESGGTLAKFVGTDGWTFTALGLSFQSGAV